VDPNFEWRTRDEKMLVVAYWWEMQDKMCCICGKEMLPYTRERTKDTHRATIEHLKARRDGGPNTVGNVRLAHARCNHALGGLWSVNSHREKYGQPPLTAEWALKSGARLNSNKWKKRSRRAEMSALQKMTAEENDRRLRAYFAETKAATGQPFVALDKKLVSLPRGATLLPTYKGHMGNIARIPKPKMSATETARWLAERGIRGA
jgi:hypothetical protein